MENQEFQHRFVKRNHYLLQLSLATLAIWFLASHVKYALKVVSGSPELPAIPSPSVGESMLQSNKPLSPAGAIQQTPARLVPSLLTAKK